ncbi:MAG: caspase family protein [Thermoflexales bacterium]|nr:caspase family protein [Thermoflexales bacterium]
MANFEQGYALIIGIANYPRVRPLPASVLNDARAVSAILQNPARAGYPKDQVRLLLDDDATRQGILDGLSWLAEHAGPDATAVVYFSGHGGRVTEGEQAGNYLIAYDTRLNAIKTTAISSAEFTAALNRIRTQKLVVLLDACHSGGTGDPKAADLTDDDALINAHAKAADEPVVKRGLDEAAYDQLKQGSGRVIFASSRPEEASYVLPNAQNSLFTQCLLEALDGKAKHEGDGLLRIFDVVAYVFREVPKRHSRQHPIFKVSDLDANFPLALYMGGQKSLAEAPAQTTTAADLLALLPKQTTLNTSSVVAMRDFVDEHYTLDEMEVLCADVAAQVEARTGQRARLSLSIVGAAGKPQKLAAQAIVDYLNRRGWLPDLIEVLRRDFPGQV